MFDSKYIYYDFINTRKFRAMNRQNLEVVVDQDSAWHVPLKPCPQERLGRGAIWVKDMRAFLGFPCNALPGRMERLLRNEMVHRDRIEDEN